MCVQAKADSDDEDKYADDVSMPGQKFETKQRITVRNLRIREDTAKVRLETFHILCMTRGIYGLFVPVFLIFCLQVYNIFTFCWLQVDNLIYFTFKF